MRSRLTIALAGAAALAVVSTAPFAGASVAARHSATSAKVGTAAQVGKILTTGILPCGASPILGLQSATGAGVPSYVVPFNGVVTQFTHVATGAGTVRALFFLPGAAGHFTLVGKTIAHAVVTNTVNSFNARVPVPAGAILGAQMTGPAMGCGSTGVAGDLVTFANTFDPDTQTDLTPAGTNAVQWNIEVTVEPDVDGDGFGDVSQDLCPQSALTQGPCPSPDTKFNASPPKNGHNQNAKFKFSSSVAGATFLCSFDGGNFKACVSPLKKKVSYGKHNLRVKSVSPFGIPDLSPASATFRVTKKTPHHHH